MFTWIKNAWSNFEAWVHSWFPGFKTQATTALGALGMAAASAQEYITSAPLTQFVEAKTMALISLGLFTLSFWFAGMGQRVQSRASVSQPTA